MSDAEITATSFQLGEHETTGPLPVGFQFERHGETYDHFDLSSDGFIIFGLGGHRGGLPGRVRLVGEGTRIAGGRVSYEVRGLAPRRRLVVTLADTTPLAGEIEVTVHERTGIVEVGWGGQSFGDPTIRQLERTQSSWSRANSARKIG